MRNENTTFPLTTCILSGAAFWFIGQGSKSLGTSSLGQNIYGVMILRIHCIACILSTVCYPVAYFIPGPRSWDEGVIIGTRDGYIMHNSFPCAFPRVFMDRYLAK